MSAGAWSAWLRFGILCLAVPGLGGVLGELWRARHDPKPIVIIGDIRHYRDPRRVGQLWRFFSLGGFLGTVIVTEVILIGHVANWHTWTDLVWSASSVLGVSYERRRKKGASA